MPNSVFCRTNKNWVVFDTMATGHLPVGHMTVFPTLLDSVVEIPATLLDVFAGSASRAGDELRDGANAFFRPQAAERTSPLARRNRSTRSSTARSLWGAKTGRATAQEFPWRAKLSSAMAGWRGFFARGREPRR